MESRFYSERDGNSLEREEWKRRGKVGKSFGEGGLLIPVPMNQYQVELRQETDTQKEDMKVRRDFAGRRATAGPEKG